MHLLGDVLAPSTGGIVWKPMVSSITTIRNYPRGACLHPALLSCIRADIPLFTLKSDDESIKRRKWRVCRKAGRESSKAPRGHSWMMVIEDTKGNTTITRMRGIKISHKMCKYPNGGGGGTFTPFGRCFGPQHGGNGFASVSPGAAYPAKIYGAPLAWTFKQ